ncbi:MAG: nucleotidyltransferase family protein [Actinomycetota bacterium]|nr:nucleotidyltransferase family protein [Actinomycetota bacterium]
MADHVGPAKVAGLLLAAGEGSRLGRPKAIVDDWLVRGVHALQNGGCDQVSVVLGAAVAEARRLVPASVAVVVAEDWAEGMGASLRAGLESLPPADAALVSLVDLPDVDAAVVRRVLAGGEIQTGSLRRASYAGTPGHPVLIGRDHWSGVIATATGDQGARDYLSTHVHELVECADLATGEDVDAR